MCKLRIEWRLKKRNLGIWCVEIWLVVLPSKQVVKVIWHKAALSPHMVSHIRQVAPMCLPPHKYASFGPPESSTKMASSVASAVFAQLMAHSSGMPGHVLSPKNCSYTYWDLDPYMFPLVQSSFFSALEPTPQTSSWSVQPFVHSSRQIVIGHAWACPFPKNCPFAWESGPPSNLCFLGPTWVHNANGISIGSAIFALLTS